MLSAQVSYCVHIPELAGTSQLSGWRKINMIKGLAD